jgi:HSP20 family molecular chaperone IbpA
MFCGYCGTHLSDKWRYCPYCGRKINGEPDPFEVFFRSSIRGFKIHISSAEKKPKPRVSQFGVVRVPIDEPDKADKSHKRRARTIQRVVEPEGMVQHIGQHTLIRVKLPGIREEDVDVRKLSESVEIKAHKENETYFKQFQIPLTAKIISKHMEGDELIVEVG